MVRKGRNANGSDTFLVQAAAARTAPLTGGFPARREDLYAYDALVIANIEGDFFTILGLPLMGLLELLRKRGVLTP